MKIAVAKEIVPGERRVALVPESVSKLTTAGFSVAVQQGAGAAAHFRDADYEKVGAEIVADKRTLWGDADIILKVQRPVQDDTLDAHELDLPKEGAVLVGMLNTLIEPHIAQRLAERNVTGIGLEAIPRIARAQSMDVLSSMASIVGYRAAIIAAHRLSKYMPLLITAAGTVPPAKGLVLGAGVAGLQAIATARRLGAVLEAFDVRPAVKEQVESLGASFVEVDYGVDTETEGGYAKELPPDAQERQRAAIHERIKGVDFVITTASIPGRRAPLLVTKEMVEDMKPGSVIVDTAAETGGNCELTKPGETVVIDGVTIVGPVNMPSDMATVASQFFSRNVTNLLMHMQQDGRLQWNFDDEITAGVTITHAGEVRHEPTKALLSEKE